MRRFLKFPSSRGNWRIKVIQRVEAIVLLEARTEPDLPTLVKEAL